MSQHGSPDAPCRFVCPLTLDVMENPVTHKETGKTFEKEAILEWVYRHGNATCPLTRKPLHPADLQDDDMLQFEISQWKEISAMEARLESILY
ncbi:Putative E3 ubiquitin-protein ligase LIN [Seminavis robusta]|uniref:E3 ubiquitin-protein ligase LIN n=1 Tax=Seminavis robusta TaxID=568900 RepID=A0A9N8ECF6_9STRA|nr:Putative E3 ubiquitin-protein ligase LIN [Seminavis robusta]|eukprot:Sro920_g220220.1 Putative E3 ubiquitin-protein ligase LIN (93) ;mRNA; r:15946-16224